MTRFTVDWHAKPVTRQCLVEDRKTKRYHFRSKTESRFAEHLEYLVRVKAVIYWDYEPQTFLFDWIKRGTRTYQPDFRVQWADGEEIWYEIKVRVVRRDNIKWRRLLKLDPGIKLVVVFDSDRRRQRAKIDKRIPLAAIKTFREMGV